MKAIKRLFKYTFISAPKTMAEMVEFNSDRIGALTTIIMISIVLLALFGVL